MEPGESAALTPGQRAQVDQVLSLITEVDKAWPFNQQLLNDREVEDVFLGRSREGCARPDRAYLIWKHERVVELDHALTEHDIARQVMASGPRAATQECDLCPVTQNIAGVAVVASPPVLIAFVLCANCASRLGPDVLIPMTTGGNDA